MLNITNQFKDYLINIHKIKNSTSAEEYIRTMPKISKWFIQKGIISADYQLWDLDNNFDPIIYQLKSTFELEWKNAAKKDKIGDSGFMMATWNRWIEFITWNKANRRDFSHSGISTLLSLCMNDFEENGLLYSSSLLTRFLSSLMCKPFVILTGLSGSGKTKIAQAFASWISESKDQYIILPVGADWTNREPLLGYPNSLEKDHYVMPDNGVLNLILSAYKNFIESGELLINCKPYFLILDEMNLSHVERYFSEFLSSMESNEYINLYTGGYRSWMTNESGAYNSEFHIEQRIKLPPNLFIIGTVNIDETTYMFSPKVLDRANTIEFRVSKVEMQYFLGNIKNINIDNLSGNGASMAKYFLEMAGCKQFPIEEINVIKGTLVQFFGELTKTGSEFGFRTATEILRLIHQLSVLNNSLETTTKIDIAIIQKLLPKLHGSRRKLCPILETLGSFCIDGSIKVVKDVFEKTDFNYYSDNVIYPISLEKITRMYRGAIENGFASFAEA